MLRKELKPINLKILILFASLIFLMAAVPDTAYAQESGNFCVQDYLAGAGCTANDVRIERVIIHNLVKACNEEPNVGYMVAEFEVLVSAAGSPNRYDIGIFMAQDGGSALSGNSCYHDYLAPPVSLTPTYGDFNTDGILDIYEGPWWNGEAPRNSDLCGDMATNTQVFRVTQAIQVACADSPADPDNAADISVCTSWDNNAGTACNAVQQAFPGTSSKCSCSTINLPFTPTAIELAALSARSRAVTEPLYLAGFGLLMVTGGGGLLLTQRKKMIR